MAPDFAFEKWLACMICGKRQCADTHALRDQTQESECPEWGNDAISQTERGLFEARHLLSCEAVAVWAYSVISHASHLPHSEKRKVRVGVISANCTTPENAPTEASARAP